MALTIDWMNGCSRFPLERTRIPTLTHFRSDAKSLKGQDRWNQGMQRKYIDMIGSIDTLTKEVATLRKQVDVLSSRDTVKTREAVGSKRQKQ